jgi:hypothetical protein
MKRKNSIITFLCCFLIAFSSLALAQIRVACVGDSITAGWKLKEADKYVTKLGGMLGSDYDVQNFGHSAYSMLKIADKSYWNSPMFQAAQDFECWGRMTPIRITGRFTKINTLQIIWT